ncbi:hypothetical protein MTZ49_01105 [Entomomonas sp. E2T0]|uniref:VOC family protein n=1 Tax=Entomomonas sp. E2T0 TaxID=2930213 RepID=UPI002228103E|nr:VOC family protein [Entomomonas sp. E2T0]UYZ84208.1 hypothetical protein MTZ49_01105 [Entomomonas sp. E2T0]
MQPNQTILYVEDINATVALYSDIFKCQPIENHPDYACFQLESGYLLAFWSIQEVQPKATGINNAHELIFQLPSHQAVDQCFKEWQSKLKIVQEPTNLCFGYAFMALDNNQNRLRVYANND